QSRSRLPSRPHPRSPRGIYDRYCAIRYTAPFPDSTYSSPRASCPKDNTLPGLTSGLKRDRKSTRLNSSHEWISYADFCLKKRIRRIVHSPLDGARETAELVNAQLPTPVQLSPGPALPGAATGRSHQGVPYSHILLRRPLD